MAEQALEENFGIAGGPELDAPGLQLGSQRSIIVDLAVVNQRVPAVATPEGLIAPGGKIQEGETGVREPDPLGGKDRQIIGPAMLEQARGGVQARLVRNRA